MAIVLFPLDSLHSHEKDAQQCHDHFELEIDLCHVSIFHNESKENQCEHEQHFVDSVDECELCKYISLRKLEISLNHTSLDLDTLDFESNLKGYSSLLPCQLSNYILGRAPPLA
ncbi:MAG: hypothetical protein QNJ57_13220 [Flavobacteriaceae bacterium]|nr:hypothetical protein [Flavobacteriaceae bacterium]